MARPKRDPNKKNAREKISDAFWKLLGSGSYFNITICALAVEAKVNHNTIYYYFENIDNMALTLFNESFNRNTSSLLLNSFLNKSVEVSTLGDSSFYPIANRIRLFTRGDSSYLTEIFKDTLSNVWLKEVGITKDQLNQADLIDIDFIFSGFTAIIGRTLQTNNLEDTLGIMNRELGTGIIQTLNRLQMSYSLKD